jgi:hypothetical protein
MDWTALGPLTIGQAADFNEFPQYSIFAEIR